MCSTKALIGGDGDVIADIFRARVVKRQTAGKNAGADVFGWTTAYGRPEKSAPNAAPNGGK
jgi:formate dehydrogenase iron-sulfur subunit